MNQNIQDFTEMTCTNLMIKLRVMLKKLPQNQTIEVMITREQHDNIHEPFSKKPFQYSAILISDNRYHAKITKINA